MTRVSVIIPIFNHERFVAAAVRSVIAQTYADLEIIVVDDASSDTSALIVEDLLNHHSDRFARVVLEVHSANMGAHVALNRALALSEGAYIAILNSDDLYHRDRISTLVAALQRGSNPLLSFGRVLLVNDADAVLHSESGRFRYYQLQNSISAYPSVGFSFLGGNPAISTGNLLFRRELLDDIGRFRPLRYCHDWDFVLRAVRITEPLFVPEAIYYYRLHQTNTLAELSDEVPDREGPDILSHFYRTCKSNGTPNHLAPTPANWPGLFEFYQKLLGHAALAR